ncbi:MAG TPA: DMT family transporter [Burkholderiales bacterium]|jgi:drug/metabolite transporter (DMT)-like permease|nr:DMT family transporter [Burkholderiales bacterium]
MSTAPSSAAPPSLALRAMPAVFVLLWATGFIGAKLGLPYAPPLKFLLWRYLVVVALMAPLAWLTRAPWPRGIRIWHVAVAGVLMQAGYLGGVFVGISLHMPAGLSSLIVGMQPLLTGVIGVFAGERLRARQWAGLGLGFAGVVLVVSNKVGLSGFGWEAVACTSTALVSITLGTLYQRKYCGGEDLRTQSVVQFAAAALVLLPLSLAFETREVVWNGPFVFALLWLVFVLSFGATSLLMLLLRKGAATLVSSLMYLVPPVTALIAYALFDEHLGLLAILGMAVAAVGVALVVRTPK